MTGYEERAISEVTIQVPLRTSAGDARWLAAMLPYLAAVVFEGTNTTCILTAPRTAQGGLIPS